VTRGKANGTLALAHALKAAAFLEFTSDRGANIYSDDVLQVHEAVQIIGALETMLFYDEVPPIRAGAREDNTGRKIRRLRFAAGCPYQRNFR
jgi:hypothetical protein